MKNLQQIADILNSQIDSFEGEYWIPEKWNTFGYLANKLDSNRKNEMSVNPHHFFSHSINEVLRLGNAIHQEDGLKPLEGEENLSKSVVYTMLPRMFTAWNHYDENLISGSFLKCIALLPYLKKLNTTVIYLLPVFSYSEVAKKGGLGSPYAIADIYNISHDLHDALLGEDPYFVKTEFKAFVEACHLLGIRVMVDFVFRTVARDSIFITDHPDWFYWIDKKYETDFAPPYLKSFSKPTPVSASILKSIYEDNDLGAYLSMFRFSPDKIHPEKWEDLKMRQKRTGENILALIEETFGITTAPGFADVINDQQPAWSDVTYLRIYFDAHKEAKVFMDAQQPPYILYDIAKASVSKGEIANLALWESIADVIPYYQREFGLDGARIDMGHALPQELNEEIIRRVKSNHPHFLLWSEEFNPQNSEVPLRSGFQFMTGGLWKTYPRLEKPDFFNRLMRDLLTAQIPISAALESPDTPRAAYLYKPKKNLELMLVVNAFIPNAVTFVNNGLDLMELQPMNLGLGNTLDGKYVLPKEDPMYGKLAFFDSYRLHWTQEGTEFIQDILLHLADIKERYADLFKVKHFVKIHLEKKHEHILPLFYAEEAQNRGILFLANRMKRGRVKLSIFELIQNSHFRKARSIYKNANFTDIEVDPSLELSYEPKEYEIFELKG
jgi:starch synthase (maltosyl-transferring)